MSFLWPGLLWLFATLPGLRALLRCRAAPPARYAARYASLLVVKDARGRGPGMRRHIPAILFSSDSPSASSLLPDPRPPFSFRPIEAP